MLEIFSYILFIENKFILRVYNLLNDIGLVNLSLSFVMKDICMAGMNFLIYLGLSIYFFNINKDVRKEMNGEAEGAIDIIMAILSVTLIAFLIFKYKNTTLN